MSRASTRQWSMWRRPALAAALLALALQWLVPIGVVAAAAAAPLGVEGPICTVGHGADHGTGPAGIDAHLGCAVCCQAAQAAVGLVPPATAVPMPPAVSPMPVGAADLPAPTVRPVGAAQARAPPVPV